MFSAAKAIAGTAKNIHYHSILPSSGTCFKGQLNYLSVRILVLETRMMNKSVKVKLRGYKVKPQKNYTYLIELDDKEI